MSDFLVPRGLSDAGDGRQSETAREIARGAIRCLDGHGLAALAEVTLANGRRADLMGMTDTGEIWIVEIKSSVEDFRSDQKWPEYRDYCDRFFFAVMPTFPRELLPSSTGLIVADRYGGEVLRPADAHRLAAARRKAVITLFGRTGAYRLQSVLDPIFERPRRG
jgi:hypothetical protein